MSGESLDGIAAEARQVLGAAADPGEGAPRVEVLPPVSDQEKFEEEAKGWAGFPYVIGGLMAKAMPELAAVYTEAGCLEWGRAMVPVARKYGWTLGGIEGWVGLAFASWTLLNPTIDAIKRKRAQNAGSAKPEAAPAAGEPESTAPGTHPDGSPIQ
jgi:hypothetical protein